MNSTNLFSPESSATDLKSQGRTRVKVAVYSVLAVHIAGLMALLLTQGCKRDTAQDVPPPQPDVPAMDTNTLPPMDTNMGTLTTNLPPYGEVPPPYVPPVETPVAPAMTKYVVQSGDSFYSIAKAHGVSQKAVEAANPGVDPKKLKLKQEINLPAPGSAPSPTTVQVPDASGPTTYTVKSGDNLTKIGNRFGTTPKAIKALNNLATDQIKVGDKLKIPAKAAPTIPVEPVVPTMPAPVEAPATFPAPATGN